MGSKGAIRRRPAQTRQRARSIGSQQGQLRQPVGDDTSFHVSTRPSTTATCRGEGREGGPGRSETEEARLRSTPRKAGRGPGRPLGERGGRQRGSHGGGREEAVARPEARCGRRMRQDLSGGRRCLLLDEHRSSSTKGEAMRHGHRDMTGTCAGQTDGRLVREGQVDRPIVGPRTAGGTAGEDRPPAGGPTSRSFRATKKSQG